MRLLSIARLVGFSTLALAEGTRWGNIPQAREREGGKTQYGICDAVLTALWKGAHHLLGSSFELAVVKEGQRPSLPGFGAGSSGSSTTR